MGEVMKSQFLRIGLIVIFALQGCGSRQEKNESKVVDIPTAVALLTIYDEHPQPSVELPDGSIVRLPVERNILQESVINKGWEAAGALSDLLRYERMRAISASLLGEIILRHLKAGEVRRDVEPVPGLQIIRYPTGEGKVILDKERLRRLGSLEVILDVSAIRESCER